MLLDVRTYTCKPGTIKKHLEVYEQFGKAPQTKHLGQPIAYKFQFCSPHHPTYYIRINGGMTVHNSNYDKRVISYMTLMEVG